MKTISVFGSTGSIGEKALLAARNSGFKISVIACNRDYKKLIDQALEFAPEYVYIADCEGYKIVCEKLKNHNIKAFSGSAINDLAAINVDCGVMAISGISGLLPTFSCLGHAKRLAIATKEVIISAGKLLINQANEKGTEIIPIDSEHSSIFQCLLGEKPEHIKEIILTASGGPFVDLEEGDLKNVTIQDALKHPNWKMGSKITIDSATLINKALEIIEASFLFNTPIEKITPLIHHQSLVHGLVRFIDNSFKAAISFPDMILPITYALSYPNRTNCDLPNIDFCKMKNLEFRELKPWQKRNIDLAYSAFKENKVIALNILNEIAVKRFLSGEIAFSEIYSFISNVLEDSQKETINSIDDITETIKQLLFNSYPKPKR